MAAANTPVHADAGRLGSLEPVRTAAVIFRVREVEYADFFKERCHADLHFPWSFHCGRG